MAEEGNAARRALAVGLICVKVAVDRQTVSRLRKATELSEAQILEKNEEFLQQYPEGKVSKKAFEKLCRSLKMPKEEVAEFTQTIFDMFDLDENGTLCFEEYTLATEQFKSNPKFKLEWLFDNLYDTEGTGKCSRITLEKSIEQLLRDECYERSRAKEILADIVLDLNRNCKREDFILKKEFIDSCLASKTLKAIMMAAAENEGKRAEKERKKKKKTDPQDGDEGQDDETAGGDKKDKKKKKKKKKRDEKYISITPTGSRRGSNVFNEVLTVQKMSRRRSLHLPMS